GRIAPAARRETSPRRKSCAHAGRGCAQGARAARPAAWPCVRPTACDEGRSGWLALAVVQSILVERVSLSDLTSQREVGHGGTKIQTAGARRADPAGLSADGYYRCAYLCRHSGFRFVELAGAVLEQSIRRPGDDPRAVHFLAGRRLGDGPATLVVRWPLTLA